MVAIVIDSVTLSNFKSFAETTKIPFAPITVLLGKNNSGKTTVMRLPALLLDGLAGEGTHAPRFQSGPIPLFTRGIEFASSWDELVYGADPHGAFGLGIAVSGESSFRCALDVQLEQSLYRNADVAARVASFAMTNLGEFSREPRTRAAPGVLTEDVTGRRVRFDGIYPAADPKDVKLRNRTDQARELARAAARKTMLLSSIRSPARAAYTWSFDHSGSRAQGSLAPYMLYQDEQLLRDVAEWYDQSLGASGLSILADTLAFQIVFADRGYSSIDLTRSGRGVQQVLAVVTYLKAMAQANPEVTTLFIEEPELHLHPAAHVFLADAIVDVALRGQQVVVETHSETLILRLRRHVAAQHISQAMVQLLWFDASGNRGTKVRSVHLRSDGSVDGWPRGVFAEDLDEVRAISSLQRTGK